MVVAERNDEIVVRMSVLHARFLLVDIERAKEFDPGKPLHDSTYKIEKCIEKVLPNVDDIKRHEE